MIKKMIPLIIPSLIMVSGIVYSFSSVAQRDIIPNAREYFQSEERYVDFIKNSVEFENVRFEFVTVRSGDNFWKIARKYNINIDTLIGINIFWEDLTARTSQVVIVPSESGTMEFINDPVEVKYIAESYGVEMKDIEIQKLPAFFRLRSLFQNGKKPIAVFIKDAKPDAEKLTSNLARKFAVREMFRSPLGGRLSSFFGNRKHPVFRKTRFHNGLDIAAPYGTYVGAARGGEVIDAGWMGGYGKAVIVRHDNGYKTLYGHLSKIFAKRGQHVSAGKIIGRVGSTGMSTGPHLHFTIWQNGRLLNPMDVLW